MYKAKTIISMCHRGLQWRNFVKVVGN